MKRTTIDRTYRNRVLNAIHNGENSISPQNNENEVTAVTSTAKFNRTESKKTMEFSKKWLITCMVISTFFTMLSYVLSYLDKNPVTELASVMVQALWGASSASFAGYIVQNCVRAYTATKFQNNNTTGIDPNTGGVDYTPTEIPDLSQVVPDIQVIDETRGDDNYDYR